MSKTLTLWFDDAISDEKYAEIANAMWVVAMAAAGDEFTGMHADIKTSATILNGEWEKTTDAPRWEWEPQRVMTPPPYRPVAP